MGSATRLVFGEPVPVPASERGPGARLRAFERRVVLTGRAPRWGVHGRFENVSRVYPTLPEKVRAALRYAAVAGLEVSVGTHTTRSDWRYVPRAAHAVVRGDVTGEVELVITLSGFVEHKAPRRGTRRWFGWTP